jgi:3-deoxy-D-manno-octulosonic-acid transferase
LNRAGVKKILLNGRVSDAMRNSPRWLRPMYEFIFNSYEALGMQADTDAARVRALGAPPEKVHATGNLKFEGSYLRLNDAELRDYRDRLKVKLGDKVVVAGSTHPGEEDKMMQVFIVLKNIYPSMKLIIAPRAVERTAEVEEIVKQWGFRSSLVSKLDGFTDVNEIVIVDVIGELARLYAIGQAAFVGGSLVERGGQNLLEPVFQGIPVVHGPYVQNFRDMGAFLGDKKRACAYKVNDVHELSLLLKFLIEDDGRIAETRERCFKAVEEGSGATGRSLKLISEVIGE